MCDVVLRTRVRPEELWISAALGGPLLPVELSAHTSLLNTSCFFSRKALKKEGLGGQGSGRRAVLVPLPLAAVLV